MSCDRCGRLDCICGMPTFEAGPIVARLRALLERMTGDERIRVIDAVKDGYCRHCGNEQRVRGRSCQCWNDE